MGEGRRSTYQAPKKHVQAQGLHGYMPWLSASSGEAEKIGQKIGRKIGRCGINKFTIRKTVQKCNDVGVGPSITVPSLQLYGSPPPIFRVLFIQDPGWRKEKNSVLKANDVAWTEASISEGRWEEIKQNPASRGFIYDHDELGIEIGPLLDGQVKVSVDEWVSI
jgi:hypothetical protein